MHTSIPFGMAACLLLLNSPYASAQQVPPIEHESVVIRIEPLEMGPMQTPPLMGELEFLAVDIARRSVLAQHPRAANAPIRTVEFLVRPAGDEVHTYAKLLWTPKERESIFKWYTSEVYATLIYTREMRRVYEISYRDNFWVPFRNFTHIDLVSKINEEFDRRDGVRAPHPQMLPGPRLDCLAPRARTWRFNPFGGDRPWHVSIADDRVRPALTPLRR